MVGVILAIVVAALWCAVAIRLGPQLGYVDIPDDSELKAHERPAVPLGGVGVFAGLHIGLAAAGSFDGGLFVATGLALALGLTDDRIGLSPMLRLVAEVGIGAVLVLGTDTSFDDPLGIIVGIGAVVVVINAVNLFDGLDGLAGSATLVAALGFAWLAALRGVDTDVGLVLAAALVGFLVFNWHPARVFLGDNGAYAIGVTLAYLTFVVTPQGVGAKWLPAVVALGVFLLDLVATVLRRRLAGRPLFAGDRSHLYDQLRERGLSVRAVAGTAAATQGALVGLAAALEPVSEGWLIVVSVLALAALLLGALWRAGFLTEATPPGPAA